jgi:hypothetical protein
VCVPLGNITPVSDEGKVFVAVYAVMVCSVFGGFLEIAKSYLESFCQETPTKRKRAGKKSD